MQKHSDTGNDIGNAKHIKINHKNTPAIYLERMTSRNYRKQPQWALHAYIEKYYVKVRIVYHEKYDYL